jgi:hypothetical protein
MTIIGAGLIRREVADSAPRPVCKITLIDALDGSMVWVAGREVSPEIARLYE